MPSVPTKPKPGDVWFADLGIAEKNRPVLVLAYPGDDDARALVIVAPLTSQLRGMRGEVPLGKPRWLPKLSAVNVQGLASFDCGKLTRHMGTLSTDQMNAVKAGIRDLLGL
jgi:mRNA interferase MazF